ncbi:MAG: AAA family ATPase [Ignavibacteriales bacterium]|nr:MAG: AAA family ATPase [Ignavibacteriales bacterium]
MVDFKTIQSLIRDNSEDFNIEVLRKFPTAVSAFELQNMIFPPIEWFIHDFLTVGLYILAGKPKSGKSWLALNLSLAVAEGGRALSYFSCNKNDVLYIAYEDSPRRLQSRVNRLIQLEHINSAPSNLLFYTMAEFPKLNDGGLNQLDSLLKSNRKIKIVIIDTLGRSSKKITGFSKNQYLEEYDHMAQFQEFATAHNICLLFLHHTRKLKSEDPFEDISGTNGLLGAADGLMVLERNSRGTKLHINGKDILETSFDIVFNDGLWFVTGNATNNVKTKEREEILNCFEQNPEKTLRTSEIAIMLNKKTSNISHLLKKLVTDQFLIVVKTGMYRLSQKFNG